MEELKKCPFCKGEVEIRDFYLKGVANRLHYFCRCKSCGAREVNKVGYRTEKRAIKGWNKMCAEVNKDGECEAKMDCESEYYRLKDRFDALSYECEFVNSELNDVRREMEDYINDFKSYIDLNKKIHYLKITGISNKNTDYELKQELLDRIIYKLEEFIKEFGKENA